jgi:hypothetical protein
MALALLRKAPRSLCFLTNTIRILPDIWLCDIITPQLAKFVKSLSLSVNGDSSHEIASCRASSRAAAVDAWDFISW